MAGKLTLYRMYANYGNGKRICTAYFYAADKQEAQVTARSLRRHRNAGDKRVFGIPQTETYTLVKVVAPAK